METRDKMKRDSLFGKIPENWSLKEIGDVITLKQGLQISKKLRVQKEENGSVPLLKITDLPTRNYSEYVINVPSGYIANREDIIYTRTGQVGLVYTGINGCVHNNCFKVIANDKLELSKNYIYYYLNNSRFREYANSIASGSVQKDLTHTSFKKILIAYPDLETQEKIASILSALDDKIEINNEMNKTLEEMAQTLFKRWFIDFDFPNENGEPYRSSGGKMVDSEFGEIPEGWEVVSFSELIELFNGYSYKGKELMKSNNAMITIKNFNRNGGFQVEGFKEISISDKVRENHYVNKGDVIVAHTDLTQGAEIIGNSIYIQTFGRYEKVITSMDTVKVKSKNHEISNLLIHMFLNHKKFKEHALGYVNGTTVLHLSKKAIPEYKIAIPINKKIFDNMDKLLKPIYIEQNLKLEEVWELTKLRDTLLPKLMSGEVEV